MLSFPPRPSLTSRIRFTTSYMGGYGQINRPPPEPKGTIDSLALLTQRFGRRAGNMKMATLADYFGLGKQSHRSLDDVRMNLEVLKYCATVLFLESSLPDIFTENSWVSSNSTTRTRSNANATGPNTSPSSSNSPPNQSASGVGQQAQPDPFDLGPLIDKIENEAMEEEPPTAAAETAAISDTDTIEFLDPDQIRCNALKIRFGISTKFVDQAGRPRLSFVVDAPPNLCGVLDACDNIAKRFVDSDSNSEWRPVVSRKPGFYNSPTVRLQLPTVAEGDSARWITEIYQKESSSLSVERVMFSRYDVAELEALIRQGSLVDACFLLDPYDYRQSAGIRLVAKKLIVNSN
ncbi:unnamed protein product [Lactuca saligna]|uniref:Exonuclease domain-containing protein n=1 Tax=Lactuca saligna TaxID=75948 RepID=A0AA35Z126_LACSI|nr:unnamed protein product [Lactuca saligna]